MATTPKTFSVRYGIDVANTIIVSNTSGVINISNVQLMNVVNLNVSGNISNTGNLLVSQNTFTGNLVVLTQANTVSLNVSANISNAGNILVTQNIAAGNIAITQNASVGNLTITAALNVASLNVSGNISNTGNLLVSQNTFTGNLSVTQNVSLGNVSVVTLANIPTLNVTTVLAANGTLAAPSISFGAQTNTGIYLGGTNQLNIGSNGNLVVSIAQTAVTVNTTLVTINGAANITGQANLSTLNVSGNISNTGNILVTQNTFTGNLSVTQNIAGGNISVANGNFTQNIANAGNVLVTQNTFTGNLNVTQNAVFGNANLVGANSTSYIQDTTLANANNINWAWYTGANNYALATFDNLGLAGNQHAIIQVTRGAPRGFNVLTIQYGNSPDLPNHTFLGNVITTSNVVPGNLVATQNISGGNLSVTQNASFGNIANAANILVTQNITAGNISITQNAAAGNLTLTQNLSVGNITTTKDVTIAGNLIVNGTTVTINATSVQTNDQYIMLASNNYADTLDVGFASLAKNTTQGNVYSGLIKHAADETWHLFEGYALMNAYPSTINTAQTNVATLNANIIAAQMTLGGVNVASWITQQGNLQAFVNGTVVGNSVNSNINFVAGNTSNLLITGTLNASPGNVTITFDTRNPPGTGGGGGSVNAYANVGLVASAIDNIAWLNTMSILYTVTQNASETKAVNVQPTVNATLNLTSLNLTSNLANAGNILITQNTYTGNLSITQNASTGNLTVATLANTVTLNVSANIANAGNVLVSQNTITGNLTAVQNIAGGNIAITQNATFGNVTSVANIVSTGNVSTTGNVTINTLAISVNTVTLATVSQTGLDNFFFTGNVSGGFASVEYTVQANCANSFHLTKIMVLTDGTNVWLDEYGTLFNNGPVGTFTAAISGANCQLLFTANNATSTVVRTARYGISA